MKHGINMHVINQWLTNGNVIINKKGQSDKPNQETGFTNLKEQNSIETCRPNIEELVDITT